MEHLKECRKKCGLTLDEAAARLNISHSTLSMYESGKLSAPVTVIAKMLRLYRTDTINLLGVNAPDLTDGEKLYNKIAEDVCLQIGNMERVRKKAGMKGFSANEKEWLHATLFNDICDKIFDDELRNEVIRLRDSSAT